MNANTLLMKLGVVRLIRTFLTYLIKTKILRESRLELGKHYKIPYHKSVFSFGLLSCNNLSDTYSVWCNTA